MASNHRWVFGYRWGRLVALIAGLVTGLAGVVLPASALSAPRTGPVVVLSDPWLTPSDVPAGFTPDWVVAELAAQGIDAVTEPGAAVPANASAIINPYGAAYPDTAAVASALSAGAGWVNPAGVPFSMPNGQVDPASPARFGVFAPPTPSAWFTTTTRTELGKALLPALPTKSENHTGWAIHAAVPSNERPLATYQDAAGIDGGPAITLIVNPDRIVAFGYTGDGSPLNPAQPDAGRLLSEAVRVAADRSGGISDLQVAHYSSTITVSATGTGNLTGTGTFPAPAAWSPSHPQAAYATVRLYRRGRLVDLESVASNPATVTISGTRLLVNGQPFIVRGMVPGYTYPVGTSGAEQATLQRQDYARMHTAGANAIRSYGYLSDWTINAAAAQGLFVMDALPLGTLSDSTVQAALPWAAFIGARDREVPNMLIYSLGNETQDGGPGDPSQVTAYLAQLDHAIKDTDRGTHPITYAAAEEEPWILGPMPFLDVYGYNTYGATWPIGLDNTGFEASIVIAQEIAGDRPMLITEWGVNNTPSGQSQLVTGQPVTPTDDIQSATIVHKWDTILSSGAAGGYYFQWSDDLKTALPLPIPGFQQTIGSVEYPPGTGYHPFNEEDFWGLNDVWRHPRPELDALTYAYTDQGTPPVLSVVPGP